MAACKHTPLITHFIYKIHLLNMGWQVSKHCEIRQNPHYDASSWHSNPSCNHPSYLAVS